MEHEIFRKPTTIAPHGNVPVLDEHTLEFGQVSVEDDVLAADHIRCGRRQVWPATRSIGTMLPLLAVGIYFTVTKGRRPRPALLGNMGNAIVACLRRRQRKAGKPAVNMKTGAQIMCNPALEEEGCGSTSQSLGF